MPCLDLAELTRNEITAVRDAGAVIAIPAGAVEQHGSHMPVGTDAFLCTRIAARAAAIAATPVLLTPTLPYGFSPHHLSQPGTVSLRLNTYLAVLADMARSFADAGFRRIAFVNGHGGNSAPLRSAVAELVTDGVPVTGVDYWAPSLPDWTAMLAGQTRRFGHACEFETALLLATERQGSSLGGRVTARKDGLAPRTVQPWILPGESYDPITEAGAAWPPIFQADDVGYYGDPAAATRENGERIAETVATALARFFDAFAATGLRVGRGMAGREVSEPLHRERRP